MLLLGLLAAQAEAPAGGSAYDLIQSEVLASDTTDITFDLTGLSATYKHLQIRGVTRNTNASASAATQLQFNGDTGSNYVENYIRGDGSTIYSGANSSRAYVQLDDCPAASSGSDVFGAFVCDILNPFDSNTYTTTKTLSGAYPSSNQFIQMWFTTWKNGNALTSIKVKGSTAQLAAEGRYALYGLKG